MAWKPRATGVCTWTRRRTGPPWAPTAMGDITISGLPTSGGAVHFRPRCRMTIRGALLAGLLSVWSEEGEASTIGRFSSSALPVRTKVNHEFTCSKDCKGVSPGVRGSMNSSAALRNSSGPALSRFGRCASGVGSLTFTALSAFFSAQACFLAATLASSARTWARHRSRSFSSCSNLKPFSQVPLKAVSKSCFGEMFTAFKQSLTARSSNPKG
mmetsp:Transcript_62630/g.137137  ORF Transcript_62630/g.137137 Transcript_62630/m.137137 type:complete len:213 (+) Transcript_62630:281-919(+)